jgi:hypothetical protein
MHYQKFCMLSVKLSIGIVFGNPILPSSAASTDPSEGCSIPVTNTNVLISRPSTTPGHEVVLELERAFTSSGG